MMDHRTKRRRLSDATRANSNGSACSASIATRSEISAGQKSAHSLWDMSSSRASEREDDAAVRQDKVLSPENRRVGDWLGRHGDLAWRSVLLDRGRSALPSPEIPASVVHCQALPAGRPRHALGLPEAFGSAGSAARQRFRGSLLPAIAQSKDSAESRATAAKEQAQRRGAERELNVWDLRNLPGRRWPCRSRVTRSDDLRHPAPRP